MNQPLHEHTVYDGGRFARHNHSYTLDEISDPAGLAEQLIPLLRSQDPEDRRDAGRIIFLLGTGLTCPDGVWVCQTEYLPDKNGIRWSNHIITWSAHLTKEEAERWHACWTEKWKSRGDYGMLPVHQENGVRLNDLRHPDADPEIYVLGKRKS